MALTTGEWIFGGAALVTVGFVVYAVASRPPDVPAGAPTGVGPGAVTGDDSASGIISSILTPLAANAGSVIRAVGQNQNEAERLRILREQGSGPVTDPAVKAELLRQQNGGRAEQ